MESSISYVILLPMNNVSLTNLCKYSVLIPLDSRVVILESGQQCFVDLPDPLPRAITTLLHANALRVSIIRRLPTVSTEIDWKTEGF